MERQRPPHFDARAIAERATEFLADMRAVIGFETLIQSEETRRSFPRDQFWRRALAPENCPIPNPVSQILE